MKRLVAILVGLVMVAAVAGCGKQPAAEIDSAKAALDAAVHDGSQVYVPADFKKVNDDMAAAIAEIKAQDDKLFKNYDKATTMLAAVKTEAESVKAKAAAEKERLRVKANADLETAKAAVGSAREMLDRAPAGKGSAADIMVMKADVTGLEGSISEIQSMVTAGDYAEASERAAAVSQKAASITNEVQAAMAKKAAGKAKVKKLLAKGKKRKIKVS